MIFKETANRNLPTILLFHGGGLSWWPLQSVAEKLQSDFHVVTPIIDGHGFDGGETFVGIEVCAENVLQYINEHCGGNVFAIGGISIGAQITAEVLSRCSDVSRFAIIESALVYPFKGTASMVAPAYKLFYRLIKRRWFARLQAKSLCVSPAMLSNTTVTA